MDTGLLILLTAVAGYLLITDLLHTRYRRPRWLGYHLLFLSFPVGTLLLPLAFIISDLLSRMFSFLPQFSSMAQYAQGVASMGDKNYVKPLSVAWISFALALLAPKVYEWLVNDRDGSVRDRHIINAAKARGSFIEIALREAMLLQEKGVRVGVEILLENDMVYAGIVMESGITVAEKDADIKLMLMYARYWNKNTGKFVMIEDHADDEPEDWPVVTVPIRRIVSIRKIQLD